IRRICEAVDLTVDKLRRVAIGGLNIASLGVGRYVFTTRKELLKALGLNDHGERVTERKFISAKKSLKVGKIQKIVAKTARLASEKKFQTYRKESYYETVKAMKALKAKAIEQADQKASDEIAQEKAAYLAKTLN